MSIVYPALFKNIRDLEGMNPVWRLLPVAAAVAVVGVVAALTVLVIVLGESSCLPSPYLPFSRKLYQPS